MQMVGFGSHRLVTCLLALAVSMSVRPARASDDQLANAAEQHDVGAVRRLLAQGADVNGEQPDGGTALHWAAHWNNVQVVTWLVAAGARVDATNDYGVTP